MATGKIKEGKLLYHLTKLDNLESILINGLIPRKALLNSDANFEDVADSGIINKRTELGLDVYVPFHFHPYSAFDVAVKNTYVEDEFIYICITREIARLNKFKILTKHPLSISDVVLHEYDDGFSAIDWETMEKKGTDDDYSKHVKMAECLTDLRITPNCFNQICVRDDSVKLHVQKLLQKHGINSVPPYVNKQVWLQR